MSEPLPRIPYGVAKQIVANLEGPQVLVVRPAHVAGFHSAARSMGLELTSDRFWRGPVMLYRMSLKQEQTVIQQKREVAA